mmetsp:Transcript_7733/g.9882  ORF Transcript_7733/g.9882 Transcript_7733/m.9882 type:complete len:249 (-) Transcript_7733:205-951(-)
MFPTLQYISMPFLSDLLIHPSPESDFVLRTTLSKKDVIPQPTVLCTSSFWAETALPMNFLFSSLLSSDSSFFFISLVNAHSFFETELSSKSTVFCTSSFWVVGAAPMALLSFSCLSTGFSFSSVSLISACLFVGTELPSKSTLLCTSSFWAMGVAPSKLIFSSCLSSYCSLSSISLVNAHRITSEWTITNKTEHFDPSDNFPIQRNSCVVGVSSARVMSCATNRKRIDVTNPSLSPVFESTKNMPNDK